MIEVHRLHLTDVTTSPDLPWTRPTFPVYAHLVLHPDGPILVDTGVGIGNALIDELYSPEHRDLDEALDQHGVAVDDVRTVITSHLHFDHCGQNARFGNAQILVQRAEIDAASAPHYTVPEWAFPPHVELTAIKGDLRVADGVRIVATPGHTPGHQSVVVDETDALRTIVCCQAAWNTESFDGGTLGDDGWNQDVGAASLATLRAFEPDRVLVSHDHREWRAAATPERSG